jgi:hypothetical protein
MGNIDSSEVSHKAISLGNGTILKVVGICLGAKSKRIEVSSSSV